MVCAKFCRCSIGGASVLFECLIGNGTSTGGQALTYFNNANARIGVGDSTVSAADTQTGLQAATNKTYKAMDASYPTHTDSTGTSGSKTITFRAGWQVSNAINYDQPTEADRYPVARLMY